MAFVPDAPPKLGFIPDEPDGMIASPSGPTFEEKYTQDAQSSLGDKIGKVVQAPISILGGLLDLGKKGLQGLGQEAGKTVGDIENAPDLSSKIKSYIQANLRGAQTVAEGGARAGVDLADQVRQAGMYAGSKMIENPIETAAGPGALISKLIRQGLSSRTPSGLEVALAKGRENQNQTVAKLKQDSILPEVTGEKPNLDVSNLISILAQGALPVPKALGARIPPVIGEASTIPLAEAAVNAVKPVAEELLNTGAGRAVTGGINLLKEGGKVVAKGAKSAVTSNTIADDAINALAPRARAIDPKKQVLAVENAKKAWKTVAPEIPDLYSEGQTLESSVKTADMMSEIKNRAFAKRQALSGQPVQVSLDPMAKTIDDLAKDEVIQINFPDELQELEALASKYRGKTVSAQTAERLNRVFNATVEQKLAALPGSDRAQKLTSSPALRAQMEASKALKKTLQESLGGEFSDAGRLYGAAAQIEEHALNQAVRQFKIENNMSLGEQLAAGGIGGSPWSTAFNVVQAKAVKMAGSPDAKFRTLHGRILKDLQKGGASFQRPKATPPIIP